MHKVEIVKREFVNGMEHRMKESNRTIEEIVLEPLAAICGELEAEFAAEYRVKEQFLTGCVDGIITGGITDDWRIVRYMHASHAILQNGLPSRWAGKRVFPNGFIEMELDRGEELVIYGMTEETRKFSLVCDGKRIAAGFDEQGKFSLRLLSGAEKVTVRLEKNGKTYPRFYAVVTRNKG